MRIYEVNSQVWSHQSQSSKMTESDDGTLDKRDTQVLSNSRKSAKQICEHESDLNRSFNLLSERMLH